MRVIVTGGGTGGHIYPALAIADEIKKREPDSDILYIGNDIGLEKDIVPKTGYPIEYVAARWFDKSNVFELAATGLVTFRGVRQTLKIMKKFKPDAVIGTGGFVCFPVIYAGHKYGAKCYIHEQNAYPGMANRGLERFVDRVFLGFNEASEFFKEPEKHKYVGNPVREVFFNADMKSARRNLDIDENKFVCFVFGGSQGAEQINYAMFDLIKMISENEDMVLLFGTGTMYYDEITEKVKELGIEINDRVRMEPYINRMQDYISAADLVVGRAGALSVAEMCVSGRACLLIPSPNVTGNHQYFNAKSVADKGGAIILEEKNLTSKSLSDLVMRLSSDPHKLKTMGEMSSKAVLHNSAELIYKSIKEDLK